MTIALTLDDVLRDKTKQIGKIYQKYINPDIDLDALTFDTNDYQEIFKFKSKEEYYKFLYEDYAFEIFAEADVTKKMLDKKLNLWHIALNDNEDIDEPIELVLTNPFEFNASIGYSYFFLSKIATRIRNVFFPLDSSDIWLSCDILITADPKLLKNKPEGKIAIKIATSYNKDCESDFEYNDLEAFLTDETIINTLIEKYND